MDTDFNTPSQWGVQGPHACPKNLGVYAKSVYNSDMRLILYTAIVSTVSVFLTLKLSDQRVNSLDFTPYAHSIALFDGKFPQLRTRPEAKMVLFSPPGKPLNAVTYQDFEGKQFICRYKNEAIQCVEWFKSRNI